MVFRIIDLFLCDGLHVLFSVALTLLKMSSRDLLALDFEGVLKYFRVSLPKRYRNEAHFGHFVQVWSQMHAKLSDKKLRKYEHKWRLIKEAEALKEEPAIRWERECKRLTALMRRLEQENDELASEHIDSRLALTRQLDELREDYDLVKTELIKYKADYHQRLGESHDTNKKLSNELEQLKQLWRRQSDKYEADLERGQVIIGEYKQICSTLSSQIAEQKAAAAAAVAKSKKTTKKKKKQQQQQEMQEVQEKEKSAFENVSLTSVDNESTNESLTVASAAAAANRTPNSSYQPLEADASLFNDEDDDDAGEADEEEEEEEERESAEESEETDKIKRLEMELARVKLELVDAQCKNQEFDHILKSYALANTHTAINGAISSISSSSEQSTATTTTRLNTRSTSAASEPPPPQSSQSSSISNSNSSGSASGGQTTTMGSVSHSVGSLNGGGAPSSSSSSSSPSAAAAGNTNGNTNNWLSKTFSQFREATNQVVQKAQKAKIQASISTT